MLDELFSAPTLCQPKKERILPASYYTPPLPTAQSQRVLQEQKAAVARGLGIACVSTSESRDHVHGRASVPAITKPLPFLPRICVRTGHWWIASPPFNPISVASRCSSLLLSVSADVRYF